MTKEHLEDKKYLTSLATAGVNTVVFAAPEGVYYVTNNNGQYTCILKKGKRQEASQEE